MRRVLSNLLPLLLLASACSECGTPPAGPSDAGEADEDAGQDVPDAGVQLTSLTIAPAQASGFVGQTVSFVATAAWEDGSERNVTGDVAWSLDGDDAAFEEKAAGVWLVLDAGEATVNASLEGLSASATLLGRATDVGVVSLSVEPAVLLVPVGVSVPVRAYALYDQGQAQDVTDDATWESLTPAVVTLDVSAMAPPQVRGEAVGFATVRVSFGGVTLDVDVEVTSTVLVDLEIVPANPAVPVGASLDLVAIGRFSDGELFNVTDTVDWTSADDATVTVDGGRLAGVATGSAEVTATDIDSGTTAVVLVDVTPAQILALDITPAALVIPAGAFVGVRATAVLTDEDAFDVTGEATWTLADPDVALLEQAPGGQLRVLGVIPATTTLTASYAGRTATAVVSVTEGTLVSLELLPDDSSLPVGTAQQFFLVGTYSDGARTNLSADATWTSSDPDVALVSQQPPGRVTALVPGGPVTVTAAVGGLSESVEITVTDAALVTLQLSPPVQTVPIDDDAQFNAIGVYSDNSQRIVNFEATWSSSDEDIATISNALGQKGLATGVAAGETTVTAAIGALSDTAVVRVTDAQVAEIFVTPPFIVTAPGNIEQAQALATYTNGTTLFVTEQAVWSVGDTNVIQVSNAQGARGRITGVAAGMTQLSATFGGVTGSVSAFVTDQGFDQLIIAPRDVFLAPGLSAQLQLIGVYAQNNNVQENLTGYAVWSSSDDSIATVDNFPVGAGRVAGHAPGTVTLSATYLGQTVTRELEVEAVTIESVSLSPPDPVLPVDAVQRLIALATLSDGTVEDVTANTTFGSDDNTVATMLDFFPGVVLALAPGSAQIDASVAGAQTTTQVTVIDAVPTQVVISPINPIVDPFQQTSFTAIAIYDDGSDGDITYLCSWSSDDTSVLLVFDEPIAKGFGFPLETGTATVTADCSGLTDTTLVTVR